MGDVGLLCAACMENIQFDILQGNLDLNLGSILENVMAQQIKSNGFALYYLGMTDIGPSMSGIISEPSYKGSVPSDFTITGITLMVSPILVITLLSIKKQALLKSTVQKTHLLVI